MDESSEHFIRLRTRLIAYAALWLLAAVAFQIFSPPDDIEFTLQKFIRLSLFTPLLVLLGLVRAILGSEHAMHNPASILPAFGSFAGFIAFEIFTLRASNVRRFLFLWSINAILFAVGIFFYLRFAAELSDGP